MATALIGGALRAGWSPSEITVVEPHEAQRDALKSQFGVETIESIGDANSSADVVIWALKPQVMREVAQKIGPQTRNALHVSIAAGVELTQLQDWLGTNRVVRAMPNTSAMVSMGVTGLCAPESLSKVDRSLAERFFSGSGSSFWVADDERMNAVTAVSGSGPAYAFHFLEGFQKAAEAVGFSADQAKEIVLHVVQGAVKQALSTTDSLSVLRERVTSKGGTTAAALAVFNEHQTQTVTQDAVQAAYRRASELSTIAS